MKRFPEARKILGGQEGCFTGSVDGTNVVGYCALSFWVLLSGREQGVLRDASEQLSVFPIIHISPSRWLEMTAVHSLTACPVHPQAQWPAPLFSMGRVTFTSGQSP